MILQKYKKCGYYKNIKSSITLWVVKVDLEHEQCPENSNETMTSWV